MWKHKKRSWKLMLKNEKLIIINVFGDFILYASFFTIFLLDKFFLFRSFWWCHHTRRLFLGYLWKYLYVKSIRLSNVFYGEMKTLKITLDSFPTFGITEFNRIIFKIKTDWVNLFFTFGRTSNTEWLFVNKSHFLRLKWCACNYMNWIFSLTICCWSPKCWAILWKIANGQKIHFNCIDMKGIPRFSAMNKKIAV